MAEVKVQSAATKVVIALSEREASVLLTVLYDTVDFDTSPEIRELAEALDDIGMSSNAVELSFNPQKQMFEAN